MPKRETKTQPISQQPREDPVVGGTFFAEEGQIGFRDVNGAVVTDAAVLKRVIYEALGSTDEACAELLFSRARRSCLTPEGALNAEKLWGIVALLRSLRPANAVEAMLILQIALVDGAFHSVVRLLATGEGSLSIQFAEGAVNRLARTMATQLETLRKLRTGADQKIVVEHITVADGGQAVVGNVTTGGGNEK